MLFTQDILVTTDHTASNKKEQIIKIARGIITRISVFHPPGSHGLVHVVLLHHEHQIAPSTENMTMIGDGVPIEWDEYYESYQPPYELKARLWGVDCDYNHTITIRVAVLPRKAILALAMVDVLKNMLGLLSPKRIVTKTEEVD